MKIRMLTTQSGSIDGIRVVEYVAGTEHDLAGSAGAHELAAAFVGAGMAVEVSGVVAAPQPDATGSADAPVADHAVELPAKRPYNRKAK